MSTERKAACTHCGWNGPENATHDHGFGTMDCPVCNSPCRIVPERLKASNVALMIDFDAWWQELRALADADPEGDSAGPDQESFEEWWLSGMSPGDAYSIVWEDARR